MTEQPHGSRTSLLAVFALLLALMPYLPGASLVSLALGMAALVVIRSGKKEGKALATAALILASLTTCTCGAGALGLYGFVQSADEGIGTMAIYEVDIRTREERILADLPGQDTCPSYLGDGRSVVFANIPKRTGILFQKSELWVKSADRETRQITSLGGATMMPEVSYDGERVAFAFESSNGEFGVGIVSVSGEEATIIPAGELRVTGVDWAPSGDMLAVSGVRRIGSALRLFTVALPDGDFERLTTTEGLGQTSETDAVWAEDGLYFVFADSIILIGYGDDELQTVAEKIDADDLFVRGGKLIVSVGRDARSTQKRGLYTAEMKNGTLSLTPFFIPSQDWSCPDVSPDLERVTYARRDRK